ncbi:MAG: response regulator, partial [Leptolyngbya sp. SIO1D8]|nr:response regulator [Leptolyngbya sp. SIO1D8]
MPTNSSNPEILLVDDDAFSRKMLQVMLQKAGYEVIEANNGREGLELYQNVLPALVLLDGKMPDMDGFDCCRQIRQLPGGKHTPILMVTGLDDPSHVDDAFTAGATDYITKPVKMPVLA